MTSACLIVAMVALHGFEKGQATFHPTPAEAKVPEPFRLPEATFGFELETVRETPAYSVAKLRFPSPVPTFSLFPW